MIDLRSDTVTKPTPEMRQVMAEAKVGDDVFREDSTMNKLEQKVARMFGFEAGLFVPSGTMSNQLCINVLTTPGGEVLIEEEGHICNFEAAAASHLSSVQLRTLPGNRGKLSPEALQNTVRGLHDWEPDTQVVALENSTNKGGGACYTEEELHEIQDFVKKNKLSVHLDGARIWNAMIATQTDPEFYGTVADTMSVCFSKGLGAAVGSMMLSSAKNIEKSRRMRKMWGGGMRQVGILAAAADYAIQHHLRLLESDHERAIQLAKTIDACSGLSIDMETVATNILIFKVKQMSARKAVQRLKENGIKVTKFGEHKLRATFHFEVDDTALEQTLEVFNDCFG